MVYSLIGIHAALGEVAILLFLWVFVELLNPTVKRMQRAKYVAVVGLCFLLASWVVGGYYYVAYYGANVKPLIKAGPFPWSHTVVMEAKEHIFLVLPFLAFLVVVLLFRAARDQAFLEETRLPLLSLLVLLILIGLSMAGMGYLIATGARAALEAGV